MEDKIIYKNSFYNRDNYKKTTSEKMEIVLMNDNTIKPTRASKESAGLDLCSSIDVDI